MDDDRVQQAGADYTNIQDAVDACDGDSAVDTVTVYDGTYNEAIDLKDYLVLQAAAGACPTILVTTAETAVDLPISPYSNTVDGFTIDGNDVATRGITHPDDNHIYYLTVKNCTIKNIAGPGVYFYLRQYTMTGSSFTNCRIHDVSGDGYYIYYDNGKINSCTFKANRFYDCGAVGFNLSRYNPTRPQCTGNLIENCFFVNNTNDWGCRLYKGNEFGVIFRNNTVSGNKDGFYGRSNGDSTIENTVIYANAGTDVDMSGYQLVNNDYPGGLGFGNIDTNPLFMATNDAVSVNFYRLQAPECMSPYNGYTEMGGYGKKVLTIGDDAGYCTGLVVTLYLEVAAPTWTNSAVNVKLSNDGVKWCTNAFVSSTNWDLSDVTYGGSSALGYKTVFYQPLDTASNALPGSLVVSNRIEYIGTTPTIAILPDPPAYFTVQAAISASTNDGDIIEIQSTNTYTITEEITLKDSRTLRARTNETPVIRSAFPCPMISLPTTPSSITIDRLTLDGDDIATRGISMPNNNAIDALHIKNCTIENIAGQGIYLYPQGGTMQNSSITNCLVMDCSDEGVFIYFDNGKVQTSTFEANKIYGCGGVGFDLRRYASARAACSDNIIRQNLFVNNAGSWGCRTYNCSFVGVTFENNTVAGNMYGYYSRVYPGSAMQACITYLNGSSDLDNSGHSILNSDYPGGQSEDSNMDADPVFVQTNNPAGSDFYRLDGSSPCISPGGGYTEAGYYGRKVLTVEDDSGYCTNLLVTVHLGATAPTWTSNAVNIKLSNDGATWCYSNFQAACSNWDLTAYGGSGGLGYKWVYYQPLDVASNGLAGSTVVSNIVEYLGTTPTIAILPDPAAYFVIQDAIDASTNDYDVIEIQGSDTYNISAQINLKNKRTLRARTNDAPVIKSGAGMTTVLYLPDTPTDISLGGLTLDGNGAALCGITGPDHKKVTNLQVTNCVIKNIAGHGFYYKIDHPILTNFLFEGNEIYNCTGTGLYINRHAAVRAACSQNTIRNNLLVNNTNDWGCQTRNCDFVGLDFVNNTVSGNKYGYYARVPAGSLLQGSIMYSNSASDLDQAGFTITYSDYPGGLVAEDNMDVYPEFLETNDAVSVNFYRLPVGSPCVSPGGGYTEVGCYGKRVLSIGDDDGYCTNLVVTVHSADIAPTWTNAAVNMRLSNDGLKWYTNTFASSTNWDLSDAAYGGNGGLGWKMVFYQPLAADSNALPGSGVVSNKVEYLGSTPTIAILPAAPAYFTIQSAIDASTNNGDIVEIQSSEIYEISVALALKDNRTLRARTNDTPVIRSRSGMSYILYLPTSPSSITLQRLTLDGNNVATLGITGPDHQAVTDVHIKQCTIKNVTAHGFYIKLDHSLMTGFLFESNLVHSCGAKGVYLNRNAALRAACSGGVFRHNMIVNNTNDWGLYCNNMHTVGMCYSNNTISGNADGARHVETNESAHVVNSIIYGNAGTDFSGAIIPVSYSDVGGYAGVGSNGNIDLDPLFVDPAGLDFHLKSLGGTRVGGTNWVCFGEMSRCIDAGDPISAYTNELHYNGNRINMGAYGNTPEASLSVLAGTLFEFR